MKKKLDGLSKEELKEKLEITMDTKIFSDDITFFSLEVSLVFSVTVMFVTLVLYSKGVYSIMEALTSYYFIAGIVAFLISISSIVLFKKKHNKMLYTNRDKDRVEGIIDELKEYKDERIDELKENGFLSRQMAWKKIRTPFWILYGVLISISGFGLFIFPELTLDLILSGFFFMMIGVFALMNGVILLKHGEEMVKLYE